MFRTSGAFRLCSTAPQMAKASWGYAMISIKPCLLHSLGQRMSLSSLFIRLNALCLNQSSPCRNAPRLLWNDEQSSWSCLSEIKIRIKLAFCPSWELLLWCLIPWVVSLPMVGGLELDKVLPVQTILWLWDLIRKWDIERDPYQWDSEHAPCAETSPHLLLAAEVFHRISHHSCLRICSHFDTSTC